MYSAKNTIYMLQTEDIQHQHANVNLFTNVTNWCWTTDISDYPIINCLRNKPQESMTAQINECESNGLYLSRVLNRFMILIMCNTKRRPFMQSFWMHLSNIVIVMISLK